MESYSFEFINHSLSDSGSDCGGQESCSHSSNKSSDFYVLSCEQIGSDGTHNSDSSSSSTPTRFPWAWNTALHSDTFFAQTRPIVRNRSVTSPTPQEVARKLSPFVHHIGSSKWQLAENCRETVPHLPATVQNRDRFSEKQVRSGTEVYLAAANISGSVPGCKSRQRPRLSTCDDPYNDLLKNGQEVVMDAIDMLKIGLRENGQLSVTTEISKATERPRESLRFRIEQVRAQIREELASQTQSSSQSPARFYWSNRSGKQYSSYKKWQYSSYRKCKFCLKKKEESHIVAHHSLFDVSGLVSCPILQQYECELCHATGRYAHTIKYCPFNNPSTPHHVILQARLRIMLRNRSEQLC